MFLSHNVNQKNFCIPPYTLCENFLSENEIQKALEFLDNQELKKAVIGTEDEMDSSVRKSNVSFHYLNRETSWLFDKIDNLIYQVNSKIYDFNLTGYDYLQYTTYENNGEYNFHTDMLTSHDEYIINNPMPRKLSISILLNDPEKDFQGGNFKFYYLTKPSELFIPKGTAIIFPSFMLHGVTPIVSGIRKSLVVWVQGPKFK